jgi:hypothetical protein
MLRRAVLGMVVMVGCSGGENGIVLLSWTVRGAPASDVSCRGVDHLALEVWPELGSGFVIEPIPCMLGRLRYDHLPEGPARVRLDGVDASGNVVVSGVASFDLRPDPNAAPAQLDLR